MASNALGAIDSDPLWLALARLAVICLAFISIVFGGKGIQAAGRLDSAESSDSRRHWLRKTKSRFSYQALILILSVLAGTVIEVLALYG